MNPRRHLMERIAEHLPSVNNPKTESILGQTMNVLQADEEEISDLVSEVDILRRGLNGILPYFPDSEVTLNHTEDADDE